jgi:hypothetical protein
MARITASEYSPRSGSLVRENATAPARVEAAARARVTAAAGEGHSIVAGIAPISDDPHRHAGNALSSGMA